MRDDGKARGQRSDVRGRRRRRSEVGGQSQNIRAGSRKVALSAAVGLRLEAGPREEGRSLRSGPGRGTTKIRGRMSEVRGRKSEVGGLRQEQRAKPMDEGRSLRSGEGRKT